MFRFMSDGRTVLGMGVTIRRGDHRGRNTQWRISGDWIIQGSKTSLGRKNESFSAVAFYPLRTTVKPLHPPPLIWSLPPPLSHNPPFKISSSFFCLYSPLLLLALHHYLPVSRSPLLHLLRLSSRFHLFSTLSSPLLTLSEIDFQLRAECLEASIFPNLTPIQLKWHPTH